MMGKPTTGMGRLLREVEVLARVHTPMAIDVLASICGDTAAPHAARVAAAKTILDRGWGKAPQVVSVELDAGAMSDDDLNRQIAQRLAAHVGAGSGAAGSGTAASDAGAASAEGSGKPPRMVH